MVVVGTRAALPSFGAVQAWIETATLTAASPACAWTSSRSRGCQPSPRVGSWRIHANDRTSSSGCRTTVIGATRSRWRQPSSLTPSWSPSTTGGPSDSRSCGARYHEVRVPRCSTDALGATMRTLAVRLAGLLPVGLLAHLRDPSEASPGPAGRLGPVAPVDSYEGSGDGGWAHAARRTNPRISERSTSGKHGFTRWAS